MNKFTTAVLIFATLLFNSSPSFAQKTTVDLNWNLNSDGFLVRASDYDESVNKLINALTSSTSQLMSKEITFSASNGRLNSVTTTYVVGGPQ